MGTKRSKVITIKFTGKPEQNLAAFAALTAALGCPMKPSSPVAGKEASGGSLVSGPVSVEQQREMSEHNTRQAKEAGKKRSGT